MTERRGLRGVLAEAADWRAVRTSRYGIRPVVLLTLVVFIQDFNTALFSARGGIAGPDIASDLGIDLRGISGLIATVGAVTIVAGVGIGWLADRHRRTWFVGFGTVISGLSAVFTGRVGSTLTLGATRVGEGLGRDVAQVPTFSLLADYYPPTERGKVFAILGMLSRVGDLMAPAVVGWMIITWGWRTTFPILGVPLVIAGIVVLVALPEPIRGFMERSSRGSKDAEREDDPQSFGEAFRTIWAVRTVRRLFIANVWIAAGAGSFLILFPFYLAEHYGLDALDRGLVTIPAAAAAMAGGFVGGGLVDNLTKRNPARVLPAVGAFAVVTIIGLAGMAFGPPLWLLVLFNTVFGFGIAMTGPATAVLFAQVIPASVRTMGLQMAQVSALPGVIILLPLAGQIAETYGFTEALLFAVPFMAIGALVVISAGRFFDLDMRNAQAAASAAQDSRVTGDDALLVCRDVDVAYNDVQVLFGVNLDIKRSEIVALLGTNGAGKSTLLRAISGTQEASGGAIVFGGRDITHMPPHEIVGRGVVHMPGGRGVFPGLTVQENLWLGAWANPDAGSDEIDGVVAMFPVLGERLGELAGSLSGGEQQMLSLCQAFLGRPTLLMIDELSLGLAPAVTEQLLEVVRTINERGTTVVVVEQSVNVAISLADRAVFMEKGQVRFDGPTSDLLARPDILRAVYVRGSAAVGGGPRRGSDARRRRELDEGRPVLEVEGLTKRFGGITAVDDVSFALRDSEVLGLIGPNGAGKTTIFDLISGYQVADAGTVRIEGADVTTLSPAERARRRLVRRFQDARLFGSLTVFENLLVALDQHQEVRSIALHAARMPGARRSERRSRERATRLLELLGLEVYRENFVKELSTGVRRLTDLACVLATEPSVLLLDEPSTGIAQAEAESLAPLLRRVQFETGCSILIIEHDMTLISSVADELLALDQGKVLTRGAPDDVLGDDAVIEAYLGTSKSVRRRSTV